MANGAISSNASNSTVAPPLPVKSSPIPKKCVKQEPSAHRHIAEASEVENLVVEGVDSAGVVLVDLKSFGKCYIGNYSSISER